MDGVEEHRKSLQEKEKTLTQEMDEMAQNATGQEMAAKETELGMLKVELKAALEKEQELIVKMATASKKLKDVDREAFKAQLVRKDLDNAEDDQDAADAKVAGMNAALTEAEADARATKAAAEDAAEILGNLTVKMGESGDLSAQIETGKKKLKSLQVSRDFAEKALDEKKQ